MRNPMNLLNNLKMSELNILVLGITGGLICSFFIMGIVTLKRVKKKILKGINPGFQLGISDEKAGGVDVSRRFYYLYAMGWGRNAELELPVETYVFLVLFNLLVLLSLDFWLVWELGGFSLWGSCVSSAVACVLSLVGIWVLHKEYLQSIKRKMNSHENSTLIEEFVKNITERNFELGIERVILLLSEIVGVFGIYSLYLCIYMNDENISNSLLSYIVSIGFDFPIRLLLCIILILTKSMPIYCYTESTTIKEDKLLMEKLPPLSRHLGKTGIPSQLDEMIDRIIKENDELLGTHNEKSYESITTPIEFYSHSSAIELISETPSPQKPQILVNFISSEDSIGLPLFEPDSPIQQLFIDRTNCTRSKNQKGKVTPLNNI